MMLILGRVRTQRQGALGFGVPVLRVSGLGIVQRGWVLEGLSWGEAGRRLGLLFEA